MIGRTIAELRPGDYAEIERHIEMGAIAEFIEAVGDYNPVHSDPAYAAATSFGEPIAPGVFTAGLISAVIGTQLPGPGAIYLSQSLKFMKPVKPGDTITARVEVLEVLTERNRVRLGTLCRNQRGEDVLSGEAWVMPSKTRVTYERPASSGATVRLALAPWTWAAQTMALWTRVGGSLLSSASQRRD